VPRAIPIEPGARFGRLTIVSEAERKRDGRGYPIRMVSAKCDCGRDTTTGWQALRIGHTTSCGCFYREEAGRRNRTHGESHKNRTTEYSTWASMIQRCTTPGASNYERYGGRGITVCDRWLNSYEAFLADMGRKPSSAHSIDRINNDGDYEPSNCRWVTIDVQARNKRKRKR
jgi:hypothetical protein